MTVLQNCGYVSVSYHRILFNSLLLYLLTLSQLSFNTLNSASNYTDMNLLYINIDTFENNNNLKFSK